MATHEFHTTQPPDSVEAMLRQISEPLATLYSACGMAPVDFHFIGSRVYVATDSGPDSAVIAVEPRHDGAVVRVDASDRQGSVLATLLQAAQQCA